MNLRVRENHPRNPTSLLGVALVLSLTCCVVPGVHRAEVASAQEPAEVPELDPAMEPLPDMGVDHLEPKVRDAMLRQRKELEDLIAAEDTPPETLAESYGRFGIACDQQAVRPVALVCYRNAERLEPDNKAWPFYQAQIYHTHMGDLEAAETCYKRTLERDPYDQWTHVELAKLERERDRLEQGAAHAERALVLNPKFGVAMEILARIRSDQEQYEEAVRLFRKALELYPDADSLHYPLGNALIRMGKVEEGEDYLDKHGTTTIAELNPLITRRVNQIEGWRQHQLNGTNLVQRGNVAGGIQQFRLAIQKCDTDDPDRHLIHANLGAAEVLYANQLRAQGKVNDYRGWILSAFRNIHEALRLNPDNQRANFNMGTIWARHLGRDEHAVPFYRRSIEMFPDQREAHLNLSLALWRLGRIDESLEEANAVIALFPADQDARRTKSRLLMRKNDWRALYTYLEESCRVLPQDRDLRHSWARVLITTGNIDQVSEGLEVLKQLAPEQRLGALTNADFIVTRSLAQMRFAQYEAARTSLEACREAGTQHGKEDLVNEATAYIAACQAKEAVREPWPVESKRLSPDPTASAFPPAEVDKLVVALEQLPGIGD